MRTYKLQIRDVFTFFFAAFSFAMPFSLYALSVSMFGMSVCIFWKDHNGRIIFNKFLWSDLKSLVSEPLKLLCILLYVTYALSVCWSSETDFWWHHLRLLAPLVVFPLIFSVHRSLGNIRLHMVFLAGIVSMLIQLTLVLNHYYLHFEEVNLSILKGKPLLTPIAHIRFSLILAGDILILLYFILTKKIIHSSFEKWAYIFLFIYFLIGIHILSVKSGLLGLYLGIFIMLLVYFSKKNQLKKLWWVVPGMISLLAFMIIFVPSLQNKYYYLLWQIGEWSRGKFHLYSDIERWQSIEFGMDIIKKHPILGTGIGDFKTAMSEVYERKIHSTEIKFPHNQFVFTWASCGIPALLVLIRLFYFSQIKGFFHRNMLSISYASLIWFSMMFEHSLETSVGVALFLWMMVLQWELSPSS